MPTGVKGFTKESAAAAGRKSKRTKATINNKVKEWMQAEGSDKLLTEMAKLKGIRYVDAFTKLAPYIYPKLAAITLESESELKIKVNMPGIDEELES